jgi:hypothetical protein
MPRSLAKRSPPPGIAELFDDPAILSNESRSDYDRLFQALASAVKPTDGIEWFFVRDVADLTWEIRRERNLKSRLLRSAEVEVVALRLTPPPPSEGFQLLPLTTPGPEAVLDSRRAELKLRKKAELWVRNSKEKEKINREIALNGFDSADIPTAALQRSANVIDAIDRRIAAYEARRMMTFKMIEHYNDALARRLERASADVIEAEYTKAAAE